MPNRLTAAHRSDRLRSRHGQNVLPYVLQGGFLLVRPSVIAPGLVPPFGLLRRSRLPERPFVRRTFLAPPLLEYQGSSRSSTARSTKPVTGQRGKLRRQDVHVDSFPGQGAAAGGSPPLREKFRERAGLHYPSDSLASRWLAGGGGSSCSATGLAPPRRSRRMRSMTLPGRRPDRRAHPAAPPYSAWRRAAVEAPALMAAGGGSAPAMVALIPAGL